MSSFFQKFLSISTPISPMTAENCTLIFKSVAALLVLWKDKPVQHAFYLSFKFIPDARICDCLGEDPKHIQICSWNELPPWLVCLYCKWLAFSPHLLASMYSANKVFVLLLLVELQLRESSPSPSSLLAFKSVVLVLLQNCTAFLSIG